MKKIILCVLLCAITHPTFAASMCMPYIRGGGVISDTSAIDGQITNNRGYFVAGSNCITGTMMCKHIYIRGEAHCSTSPVYPADNWEEYGNYCFCRITGVRALNGYLAPFPGTWVWNWQYTYGGDYCAKNCAGTCTNLAMGNGRQKIMFSLMRMGD